MRAPLIVLSNLCAVLVTVPGAAQPAESRPDGVELVELRPAEPPSWSWTHLFAPLTGLFLGGPGYWVEPRIIEIDTRPSGAVLDLFYVRNNFQKDYAQAITPVRLVLPSRIDATGRDLVTIRARSDGYRQEEVRLKVRSRTERLAIELKPLPNVLLSFSHRYFAATGSLLFTTQQPLDFRVQASPDGFRIVLIGTHAAPGARTILEGTTSALVDATTLLQVGEDLIAGFSLTEQAQREEIEPRRRQWEDPVRGVYVFALDLSPREAGDAAMGRARDVLARMASARVSGCALEFDTVLRGELGVAALDRALVSGASHPARFLKAGMRRLGELSPGGAIHMLDGSRYRASHPIELAAAVGQPGSAIGFLSLLRTFTDGMEPEPLRRVTLHSLLAPELEHSRFDTALGIAERRERICAERVQEGHSIHREQSAL